LPKRYLEELGIDLADSDLNGVEKEELVNTALLW